MKVSIEKPGTPEELVHFGVKGMKWGVRKSRTTSSGGSKGTSRIRSAARKAGNFADDFQFEKNTRNEHVIRNVVFNANEKLKGDLPAIKAKHAASGGSSRKARILHPRSSAAKAYRNDVKSAYLKRLEEAANEKTNRQGTLRYTVKEKGEPNTNKYFWDLKTEAIKHSGLDSFSVHPVFDAEGYIVRVELVSDSMAQSMVLGEAFIKHYAW